MTGIESLFGDDRIDRIVALLHAQPGWPADLVKDRQLVALLVTQYPGINLADEIVKWRAWMLDHESRKKVNHRARFTNWCSKASSRPRTVPGQRRSAAAGRGGGGSSSGGAPSPAGSFGGRSGYTSWEA
jgi:hypothetical protein